MWNYPCNFYIHVTYPISVENIMYVISAEKVYINKSNVCHVIPITASFTLATDNYVGVAFRLLREEGLRNYNFKVNHKPFYRP